MAQYPIPQFIESEAKIISFLTFRQFFILIGGGVICLILYYTVPFIVFIILSIVVAFLVAIVGFIKIDNASVVKLALNFLLFSTKSKNYVWKKKEVPYPFHQGQRYQANNASEFDTGLQKNNLQNTQKIIELRKRR